MSKLDMNETEFLTAWCEQKAQNADVWDKYMFEAIITHMRRQQNSIDLMNATLNLCRTKFEEIANEK